jgi:hypothetical protein
MLSLRTADGLGFTNACTFRRCQQCCSRWILQHLPCNRCVLKLLPIRDPDSKMAETPAVRACQRELKCNTCQGFDTRQLERDDESTVLKPQ